jgi:hypothetical protein
VELIADGGEFGCMKIRNQKVVDSLNALSVLDACKLTVKGAFIMRRNRVKLLAEAKEINAAHAELFRKHFGDLTHADGKHPNWAAFKKEAGELMAVEMDLEPQRIHVADILDAAPGLITALDALDWLIEEVP